MSVARPSTRQIGGILLILGALACFFGLIGLVLGSIMMVVGGAAFARSFLER